MQKCNSIIFHVFMIFISLKVHLTNVSSMYAILMTTAHRMPFKFSVCSMYRVSLPQWNFISTYYLTKYLFFLFIKKIHKDAID